MKKIYQVVFSIIVFLMSTSSHATTVVLEESVDHFSDEVSYTLMISDDTEKGGFAARCNTSNFTFFILPDGMWEIDDNLKVQFRFDKGEPFSENMAVHDYKFVANTDVSLATKIFKNAMEAKTFIIKVGTEDTQRFSALSQSDKSKVDKFLNCHLLLIPALNEKHCYDKSATLD